MLNSYRFWAAIMGLPVVLAVLTGVSGGDVHRGAKFDKWQVIAGLILFGCLSVWFWVLGARKQSKPIKHDSSVSLVKEDVPTLKKKRQGRR